jgi:type I restriction enzyme S subunit
MKAIAVKPQAKTNAVRLLDEAGIAYRLAAYEVDEADLSAETVASKIGLPPDQVFKTLAVRAEPGGVLLALIAAVRPKNLLAARIPLPPLLEQRRIVGRTEELVGKIEEARGLRREAMDISEALLVASSKREREHLIESEHPKALIGKLTQVTSGGTPSREIGPYWNGTIPWIKTGELLDGDINRTEECITQSGLENSSARLFPPETVLIALYGQGQTRGRTGRLLIEASTNQACCAILPKPSFLSSRYTQYWLRSLYSEMREYAHGGAQPNWNGQMIKDIEISLPPLPEQERIVAYLNGLQAKVDELKALQGETEKELAALLPSVLDRAFSGRL